MQLSPDALRLVLGHGLSATIEVVGPSMEPSIELGAKVVVVGLGVATEGALAFGDIVLVATTERAIWLLHRVMHVFEEGDRRFVVHQGDARASIFGICSREDVLARMTAFAETTGQAAARPVPTVERVDAETRKRILRRRRLCKAFVRARRVARVVGLGNVRLVRRCGQAYRRLAALLAG
jgi:hypothetical protein